MQTGNPIPPSRTKRQFLPGGTREPRDLIEFSKTRQARRAQLRCAITIGPCSSSTSTTCDMQTLISPLYPVTTALKLEGLNSRVPHYTLNVQSLLGSISHHLWLYNKIIEKFCLSDYYNDTITLWLINPRANHCTSWFLSSIEVCAQSASSISHVKLDSIPRGWGIAPGAAFDLAECAAGTDDSGPITHYTIYSPRLTIDHIYPLPTRLGPFHPMEESCHRPKEAAN